MNEFYGWGSPGSGGNPFRTSSGNPFAIGGNGARSRGVNQQDQPSNLRASGGFGAPIETPRGISRNSGVNRQDVSTWGGATPDDPGASGGNPPNTGTPPWTPLYPGMPGNPALAPTSAQVAANPGQYAGTSFDPNLSARYTGTPGGANSLPTGSENVGGVGMYTGANGPSLAGSDPLRGIRSVDQVNYYRYLLPWQQGGGNIYDENAARTAIESGIRGSGGGSYWGAWGGSPYQEYRVS